MKTRNRTRRANSNSRTRSRRRKRAERASVAPHKTPTCACVRLCARACVCVSSGEKSRRKAREEQPKTAQNGRSMQIETGEACKSKQVEEESGRSKRGGGGRGSPVCYSRFTVDVFHGEGDPRAPTQD
eukprot:964259-Pleurochrysis_carterae.AAC.1